MDIEKLIERLKKYADFEDYPVVASFAAIIEKKYLREAATALATLQAEVEFWKYKCKESVSHTSELDIALHDTETENEKLRAELEQVKQERDAAVGDIEALMWYSGEGCQICANAVEVHKRPYVRLDCKLGSGIDCKPKWRGKKED